MKTISYILSLITILLFTPSCGYSYKSVTFASFNEKPIYVSEISCGNKCVILPVGYLAPNGNASVLMFPENISDEIIIKYKINNEQFSSIVDGKNLKEMISKRIPAEELTLFFIYTKHGEFITKVFYDTGVDTLKLKGYLYPDEKDELFNQYKELVSSAIESDSKKFKNLVNNNAPLYWENEPISNSVIEWAALKGNVEILKIIDTSNVVFPSFVIANAIKLASQENHLEILEILLKPKYTKFITENNLPKILSATISLNTISSPQTLEILMEHFSISPDFRISDYGHTLLISAAQNKKENIVKYLLEKGANKDLKLRNGNTAFDVARTPQIKQLLAK